MDKCILIIDDNDQKVNVRSLKMQVKGHCNLDVIDISIELGRPKMDVEITDFPSEKKYL